MTTLVVTVNAPGRIRGFLASIMLELDPSIYIAPSLSKPARERMWSTLDEWHPNFPGCSLIMVVRDKSQPGDLLIQSLGTSRFDIVENDGVFLTRRSSD